MTTFQCVACGARIRLQAPNGTVFFVLPCPECHKNHLGLIGMVPPIRLPEEATRA